MAQETPISASSSSGQAILQLEAFNAVKDLTMEDIDDALVLDKPRHARLDEPSAVRAVEDPSGQYSPHYDGQNAPLAPVPALAHVIQTGTTTDQEYKNNFQVLELVAPLVDEKDHGYMVETHNSEVDPPEDYNDSDEDDQVDGKSFDQNIPSLGTDEVALSEKRLQQDFSPTATPDDILVPKLTTSSFEPLQKPEKVEEEGVSVYIDHTSVDSDSQIAPDPIMGTDHELVIQTGDGMNIVTA